MKKVYEKPMICYESFASSTNLAAGCEMIVNTSAAYVCGIPTNFPDDFVFTEGVNSACTVPGYNDTVQNGNDTFCYHNPDGGPNVFNS